MGVRDENCQSDEYRASLTRLPQLAEPLTVGFVAMMVFCVGQRVLPAFSGMRLLFSSKLMFAGLLLLTVGCALRVSGEVLAYQEIVAAAWTWLPYSAILELSAVTIFAINLALTFMQKSASQQLRATNVYSR